jgi:SAM-dependent methyltransferase
MATNGTPPAPFAALPAEAPTCWSCGAGESSRFPALPLAGRESFSYLQCTTCGLARLEESPVGRDLGSFYADQYAPVCGEFASGRRSLLSRLLEANFRRIAGRIEALVPSGRILDVGCGSGLFLATMERRGWQVVGVEPNVRLAEELRTSRGLDVHTGLLHDVPDGAGPFDAVTLFHVIEHVPRPDEALRKVGRLLRPGGVLVLVTPNVAALEHRLFGRHWYALQPPDHLWLFSPPSLNRVVLEAGFEPLGIVANPVSYAWTSLRRSFSLPSAPGPLDAALKAAFALPIGTVARLCDAPAELELYARLGSVPEAG